MLGVAWRVLIAVAFLTPAFWHGSHIGTYDILSHLGLSKQASGQPHNLVNADQIDSMIPWTHLVWTQVHQGHLPLWNQYTGLGLPLAFNWQSAPLGLPALVGYAVPVQYAYDVGQLVTLIVAGTGVYLLSRVSGLGVVASAFAGSVFELSGPLTGWIGYPHGEVMSWGGWLLAAAVLVIRPAHRAISIAFFAVVIAASVYSGQPEVLAVFGLGLGLFVLVVLGMRSPWARGGGPILRPVLDLALASIAGLALAAPLALPGFQVIAKSSRSGLGAVKPLQVHDLMYFIAQGFDGLPLAGSLVCRALVLLRGDGGLCGDHRRRARPGGDQHPDPSARGPRTDRGHRDHAGHRLRPPDQLVHGFVTGTGKSQLGSGPDGSGPRGSGPGWIRVGRARPIP